MIITPSFQFCLRQNFLCRRFNEVGDMLAACYLSQPPLIEVGDIFGPSYIYPTVSNISTC